MRHRASHLRTLWPRIRWCKALGSAELEAFHLAVREPFIDDLLELDWSTSVQSADETRAFIQLTFVVVVARSAFELKIATLRFRSIDGVHPCSFSFISGFDDSRLSPLRVLNDLGNVTRLIRKHMRKVRGYAVLRDAHVEAVWESRTVEAVQSLETTRPTLAQRVAAAAINFEAGATGVGGTNFESGRKDDAINLVFNAVEHQPLLGNAIDASPAGIDQGDVRPIERRQVFVVESRALAKQTIPGLQGLGGFLVLYHRIHTRPNLVHLAKIGQLG